MENDIKIVGKRRRKKARLVEDVSGEVSSIEWEFIFMTEQEEDLIHRMHRLVGDRWNLIAGRIPDRREEEIERYWIMKYGEGWASKRKVMKPKLKLKSKPKPNTSS